MGSWTWAGATSPCASTLFKASISLFSSASIITAGSWLACARLGDTCRLPFAHKTANNPECAWVQATARGFWVRLLVLEPQRRDDGEARLAGAAISRSDFAPARLPHAWRERPFGAVSR